jgi:SAM-dependent methyltransferase
MEAYEYGKMFGLEDSLWWYRGLRLHFQEALRRANLPSDAMVLDAGCGTGANLVLLSRTFTRAVGCDLSERAVRFSSERGLKRVLVADVNHLPFKSGVFDGVLCSDVLECAEVDERSAVGELARVSRAGARIILSASAYPFLMSEHDRAVHSVRRYSARGLKDKVSVPGIQIVAARHLFGFFFLPIVAYRLLRRALRRGDRPGGPQSDLFALPSFVNQLLFGVTRLEVAVSRLARLPFGTTLLVEMRRT